jgi:hypothetical protein
MLLLLVVVMMSGSLNTKPLKEYKFRSFEDSGAMVMQQFQQQSAAVLCGKDPSADVSVGCLSQHTSLPLLARQPASGPGIFNSLAPDIPVPR